MHLPYRLRLGDWLLLAIMIGALMLIADNASLRRAAPWLGRDQRVHLGAEYDSIAQAIRSGRGFADPFREPTGSTAWMPPLLPLLLAGSYWLCSDNREHVVTIIVLAQAVVVWHTCAIVIAEARRKRVMGIGYVVVTIGLLTGFNELFQKTHDVWLNLLIVNLLWLGSAKRWHGPRGLIVWGIFGGVAALCSPVLGAVWAGLTSWRWSVASHRMFGKSLRFGKIAPLLIVASLSILVVLPWTIRNRVVMGSWLPIKSNGMFELWQSQCWDDDGLLDWRSIAQHPCESNGRLRDEYRRLGEMAFIAHYAALGKKDILVQPLVFSERVVTRLKGALVWYTPHDPEPFWSIGLKRIVFPVPLLAAVILIASRRQLGRQASAAITITTMTLVPYILVSYYERYSMPLIGMKMIVVLHGLRHVSRRHHRSFVH